MKLHTEFIRLPDDDFVAAEIELSDRLRAFTGCVVVERVFGGLKRRFKILRENPAEYEFKDQIRIVYALTGIWNFVRAEEGATDDFFDADFGEELEKAQERADLRVEGQSGRELRDLIAKDNWAIVTACRAAENIL
ncbi:hypothetical protein S40293_10276 [Stachybotrys chartarum IBT 40293]|nr:hypothetical protein S40293_10276 [Stachybotrys chartarum IBT 40293]